MKYNASYIIEDGYNVLIWAEYDSGWEIHGNYTMFKIKQTLISNIRTSLIKLNKGNLLI